MLNRNEEGIMGRAVAWEGGGRRGTRIYACWQPVCSYGSGFPSLPLTALQQYFLCFLNICQRDLFAVAAIKLARNNNARNKRAQFLLCDGGFLRARYATA